MIDAGADLTAKNRLGETLLYVAAEKGEIDMARLLIARARMRKPAPRTAMSVLHRSRHDESMALMNGADRGGRRQGFANNDGETPLNWAAMTAPFSP